MQRGWVGLGLHLHAGTRGSSRPTCARSRSRRPRQEHPASGSRQDAHVRDVRAPDPPGTPPLRPSGPTDPLSRRTYALYGHFRAPPGLAKHLSPRRRSRPPASTPACTARHSPRPRGSSHPDRPDCPWHTARTVSGCDRPGRWHNQPAIIGYPPGGAMRWPACGSARILLLLKRRWRSLPMCLATAWTGRSTSSRVTRGTTACRSSSVAHRRTSVPQRPRPTRSWRVASVTVSVSKKGRPHSESDRTC